MDKQTNSAIRVTVSLAVAAVLLAIIPESVSACPVCFDSSDENRMAFLATTAFLSLVPLGLVAGTGLYIRKRSKDLGEDPFDPDRPEP